MKRICNYFDINRSKNVLISSDYIKIYDIIDDIIVIICKYCGIVDWSDIDKSNNISIVQSNDNKISYAICERNDKNDAGTYDDICFDEWINIDSNKSIFKYVFKATPKFINPFVITKERYITLRVGILVRTSHTDFDINNINNHKENLFFWCTNGTNCAFAFNNDQYKLLHIKWNDLKFEQTNEKY